MTNDQERAEFLDWHNNRRSSNQNAWAAWQARAAKPARPTPTEIAEYLKATGAYVTNDASRNVAIASVIEEAKLPVQGQEDVRLPLADDEAFKAYTTATGQKLLKQGPDRQRFLQAFRLAETAHGISAQQGDTA